MHLEAMTITPAPPYVATTVGLPPHEKFSYWHDVVSKNLVDLDYDQIGGGPFEATFSGNTIDELNVSHIKASPHRVSRSKAGIARLGSESLVFSFVLSGNLVAEQDGRTATLGVGDGVVCEARRPYSLRFDEPFEIACLQLPRESLVHGIAGLQRVTATNFNATSHLCPLAFSYLTGLMERASLLGDGTSQKVSRSFIELLCAMLSETAQTTRIPMSEYRGLALIRVKDFVERNLRNCELNPAMVAAALKLSPRYINQLLEIEGTSLSRYIWQRRLERAASDLRNEALSGLSISIVAMNNGFNDLSHFSKAFRDRFKQSPREYRNK